MNATTTLNADATSGVGNLFCRTCGTVGEDQVSQTERGTHKLRADCAACGAYIKFLSPHSPAVPHVRAEHFRRAEVAQRPVTPDQRRIYIHSGRFKQWLEDRTAVVRRERELALAR